MKKKLLEKGKASKHISSPTLKKRTLVKNKVDPLPKDYHTITPYLIVKNAAAAIAFYKKVFAAKEMMKMQMPDKRIAHAELKIGDSKIMLADECPETKAFSPKRGQTAVSLHVYVKDVDKVAKKAQVAGAKIVRAIEDMFYGDRAGTLVDPFGHYWHIATHIEEVSEAETKKRAKALYRKRK